MSQSLSQVGWISIRRINESVCIQRMSQSLSKDWWTTIQMISESVSEGWVRMNRLPFKGLVNHYPKDGWITFQRMSEALSKRWMNHCKEWGNRHPKDGWTTIQRVRWIIIKRKIDSLFKGWMTDDTLIDLFIFVLCLFVFLFFCT